MAAGTSVPSSPPPAPNGPRPPSSGKFVEYDRYIESQLSRTRRQVKWVDLLASLMLLVAGSLVYLLLAALADHWLVPGGMGFAGRVAALAIFLAGLAAYIVVRLGPLLLRRINPVYAAQAIEQSRPGLKNSLVNFLLLRSSDALPQRVYEAIEEQAANGLSAARVETAVDRTPLVKLLTLVMVLVGVMAIYRIASPKNLFTSMRRVIAPWADISAPTRVAIADIQPGQTEGYHDQHLNVSAQISGLAGAEHPTLHYSTADGQVIDHHVRMTLPEAGYRHAAELPADAAGLQQDLEYWITAGDAISPRYKVEVLIAPAIVVDSIDYAYPAYSEQTARSVPRNGDIQALEGTQITIRATATHVIQSADVDFDCDGRRDLAMKIDGRKATATFPLTLKKNSDEPEHASYQLLFRNQAGHENPKPIRYSIEVVRDLPPEIALIEPEAKPTEELQLAEGASLPLKLAASDPDFKLADVHLHATRGAEPLLNERLLSEPRSGPFERRYVFSTRSLKLKAGDRVGLWASADDNKQPAANHVETPRYSLRIVSPDGKPEQDQLANNDTNKKQPDKPQHDQPNDKSNPADRQPGDDSQPGEKQPPSDDASEQDGKDKNKNGNGRPRDKQPAGDKQEGEEQQGDGAEGDQQPQDKSSAGKKPAGQKQKSDGQNSSEENSGDSDSQSGEGQQGDESQGGKQGQGSQKSAGDKSEKPKDERVDPDKEAGRAIEEINKFFNDKQQDKEKNDQPKDEKQTSGDNKQQSDQKQQGGDKQQSGDKQQGGDKQQSGDKQQPGGDKQQSAGDKQQSAGDKQQSAGDKQQQGSDNKESGDNQQQGGDNKQPGGMKQPSGDKQGADQPSAGDEKSQGEQGQKPAGKKPSAEKSPGEKSAGKEEGKDEQNSGEKNSGERGGDSPSGKPEMKNEAQPKEGAEKQGSDGEQGKGAEKGDKQGAKPKEEGTGEQADGDKKPGEDEARPGAGQGEGNDAEGQKPSDDKQPAEKGGKPGKTKSQDQTSQKPGEGEASGQDKTKQPGEQGAGDKTKTGEDMPQETEGDQKSQAGKNGGQSKGQGKKNDKQNPDEKDPHKDAAGGDPEGQERGKGGAGQKGGNNQDPAPSPMDKNKQRDKQLSPDEKAKGNTDEESTSSSVSNHQSDSKSDKSGEHSGGGGKGGGQRSQSPGKGSAGQNTDADQGGGQSEQTGEGPKSDKGGDQAKGEKPSGGKPSDEKGPGTNKQAGGKQPGGADGEPNSDADSSEAPRNQPGDSKQEQAGGKPTPGDKGGFDVRQNNSRGNGPNSQTGGGVPPVDNPDGPADPSDTSEPGGDDPNLEFTRKATDLAIDRLKDQLQKGNPDQELLDRLKWSRKDVEQFVKRWDSLKKSAQQPGAQGDAAREELDETLRSLGLHQRGTSLTGGQKRGDQRRNLIESRRTRPPAEYADQYREYSKGVSRAKK